MSADQIGRGDLVERDGDPAKLEVMQNRRSLYSAKTLALLAILLGTALRAWQFAVNRSLRLDEAMLSLNIVNASFIELTGPLEYDQGAPIGFLFMQKAVVNLLGNRDFVLRLIPLTASLAAPFLMYRAANIYVGTTGLLSLGLFAVSERLIYYASDAKQYAGDVVIFLLLIVLAHECLRANADLKRFIGLGFVGVVSLWVSHPALFAISGISTGLALQYLLKKDWQKLRWVGGIVFAQFLSFAILYFVSLRSLAANNTLINFWRGSFMPMPPWLDWSWFPTNFVAMLQNPVGLPLVPVSAALLFIGCVSLFFRRWQLALLLTGSFLSTLGASGFEKYPMSHRFLLFLAPAMYLWVAEGVARLRLLLSKINPWASRGVVFLLIGVLLYGPSRLALRNFLHPPMGEHIKPVMSYIEQRRSRGDLIYVYYGAIPAFTYYVPFYHFGENDFVLGTSSRRQPEKYLEDIDRLRHGQHVWFLFSHICPPCPINEEKFFLEYLESVGTRLDEFRSPGASVYFYALSAEG